MAAGPDAMTLDALERELALARAERDQARTQQAALAEVLQAINASTADFQPVFDMIIGKAMTLCDAAFGALLSYENDRLSVVTHIDSPQPIVEFWQTPQPVHPGSTTARALATGRPAQIVDLAQSEAYLKQRQSMTVASVELGGIRTLLQVPLMSEAGPIGVFILYRQEVRPFTEAQVSLVEAFAGHAALAMGNARLMSEQREALEQQTATADILRVISQSPTDIEPVMAAVAKAAVRFCGAEDAHVFLRDGDEMVSSAHEGPLSSHPPGYRDALDASNTARAETILVARITHLPDTLAPDAETAYRSIRENSIQHGFRAQLNAPMLKDGGAIGCICLRRREPGAFASRQITLLETFAAQAVIAIENVRLFSELREALEQQTATAEILRAISESPTDVRPVLEVVVKAAQRFCGAEDVVVSLREGDELAIAAHDGPIGAPPPRRALDRSSTQGRAVIDARTVHLPNIGALDPSEWSGVIALSRRIGAQASLAAPMLREGSAVGAIMLRRREPGPFSPRQIELLEIFAAQAVIALSNVRLFTELRESLEQQTASADVLRVISQSPTSVQPVFDVIAESALRLLHGWSVIVWRYDGSRLHLGAAKGGHPGSGEALPAMFEKLPADDTFVGDAVRHGTVQRIVDVETEDVAPHLRELARARGWRSNLAVPMMREGQPVGVFTLARTEPGAFSDRDVQLLQSFAAQAVIAIENVRLFTELREALEQQTATSEILHAISRSPTDVQPVLDAVAKAALRFCGATDAVITLRHADQYVHTAHEGNLTAAVGVARQLDRSNSIGRAILDGSTIHLPDMDALDPAEWGAARELAATHGFRAAIATPMMREGVAIGGVLLRKLEPGPFMPRQIVLLEVFAAQAVIALQNTRLFSELKESLDYQTATSEVLEVISRSATDVQPVLDKLVSLGLRLGEGRHCGIVLRGEDGFRFRALAGPDAEGLKATVFAREYTPSRDSVAGRALLEGRMIHVEDVHALPEYAVSEVMAHVRTVLSVPLLRDGEAVGVINVTRDRIQPFSERQIALIKTFADQAVIAMENARLLSELRERTDDLTESLDYQTATGEVLEVISRSPDSLQPVLEAMTAAAVRLCGVKTGGLSVRRGNELEFVALVGQTPEFQRWQLGSPIPIARGVPLGDAILDRQPVHIVDVMETEAYKSGAEVERAVVELGGHRTILHVPLLRDDDAIGVLTVSRSEPRAFTDRQIGLIKTFADQAVVALENARLLGELRERTDDLQQSLEYQTAISDVLSVISRSTSEVEPVLNVMLAAAARLCDATGGGVTTKQEQGFRYVASFGWPDEFDKVARANDHGPDRATVAGRAVRERRVVQFTDLTADPDYMLSDAVRHFGVKAALGVPLLREGEPIGAIALTRGHVEPFTDRQIALIRTFADQAVIAIENARLLGELRERQSELRVTFDNMGDAVVMFDAQQRLAAWNRNFQEMLDVSDAFLAARPTLDDYVRLLIGRGELGEVDIDSEMSRFRERFEQQWSVERTRPNGRILEVRNNPVPGGGAVLIYSDITERKKSEAAIRSARDAAETALVQLKAAQANLVQSEKMASLGQLTAGIAHEIKNPLNFVNNFATLSVELLDELKEIAGPALETLDQDKRADLDETMGLLTGNLGKIAEHGKRADGIVKSMLSHSRGGSGDWQASDINALVEEALNLAYHGARAQDKEFNVTLERDFETAGRPIEVVPQDVTRVFLNLFGNGFYAANKRRLGAKEPGFRPTIKVTTRETGDGVEVRVRDNGTGMTPEVREKLFQAFFTTKPTGEGTGLGLSISYDIVTQQHGGTIEVESELGKFTEFTVRLPRSRRINPAERA